MKNRYLFTLLIATLATTLAGCVKEDSVDCPYGLTLDFSYTLNPTSTERFAQEVDKVELMIFNNNGSLYRIVNIATSEMTDALGSGKTYSLTLPKGNYTVVAWGNLDVANYLMSNSTSIGDLKLALNTDLGVVTTKQAALFHGILRNVEIAERRNTHHIVEMVKDVSDIRTILYKNSPDGSEVFSDYTVEIRGENGLYSAFNTLIPSELISYKPWSGYLPYLEVDKAGVYTDIRVMRLFINDQTRILVYYQGVEIYNEPLTALIMELYPTQNITPKDFDRYDSYVIPFVVNGATISVGNAGDLNGGDL